MKNKILKLVTAILLLITLTITNFIYVGVGIVSYAKSSIATNHDNVEFDAKLKDNNILSLSINVNKEGYFNGEIALENSNFSFVPNQNSNYINEIGENKIVLNQLNAGTTAQIDLQIEPIKSEIFNIGLLSSVSKLSLTGIYRDSTEKNIKIKANREVKYEYPETNTIENLESTTKIITNKIMKVSGEDKRVVQLEVVLGLKENNYPIKDIELKMNIPSVDGKYPTIIKKIDLNTMSKWDYSYQDSIVKFKFTNDPNEENNILWKNQGNEKIVLTLIFEKDAKPENAKYDNLINDAVGQPNIKVTLYNDKQLSNTANLTLEDIKEEKDAVVQVTAKNSEDTIFKGKLYSGIDRQYESKTKVEVNLANAEQYINIKEDTTKYIVEDEEIEANVVYNKTVIAKEAFDAVFGEKGIITIENEKNEAIATIDNSSKVDENNNIVIDYTGKEPTSLDIKTTVPVAEGNIEFVHTKTIKEQDKEIVKGATALNTKLVYEYIEGQLKETQAETKLEESKTEARLEVDKETLSTIVENTVEMRAVLKGNSEQYNLYENPSVTFELPEEVEEIKVNSLDLIYETELKVKSYDKKGRTLTVNLEGKQTDYKDLSIEGAVLVLNANIVVNKKAASTDSQITMTYKEETTGTDTKSIRIVAPKDVTVINSIKELDVETIGQEEIRKATLQRGTDEKQLETEIEVINNNENAIEDVKILGTFPTKNTENNIDVKVIEGISVEGAKVYYTENENATVDLQNSENAWKEEITDSSKVKKYLIEVPTMEKQASIKATYAIEIPALLEYNQIAKQGYSVSYVNTLTKTKSEMKSTIIELETGIGPKLEVKLIPTVGGAELSTGNTVKNGEVIKYKIQISNVGSEELTNVIAQGNVPEGTTLVQPQDNYEYTGASYYKELEGRTYETKIEKIAVGEVTTVAYEVRVNSDVNAGTKILNKTQVKYADVIKESNDTQLVTAKGNLRISVKRVTDRKVDLYETGTVKYFAIIENISDSKLDNITIKTNLPNTLKVQKLTLITGMNSEEISDKDLYAPGDDPTDNKGALITTDVKDIVKREDLEYEEKVNIGLLEVGEVKVLSYAMLINKLGESDKIDFSVIGKGKNEEYKSNVITEIVREVEVSLNMTANTKSQYVKSGDVIDYTITVENNGTQLLEGLIIKDSIPSSLTVNKVTFDGEEIERLKGINEIEISCDIEAESESTIKIEAVVNYSAARDEAEPITNVAYAEMLGEKVATTSEVNHIIEANKTDIKEDDDPTNGENEDDPSNGENEDEPSNGDVAKGNKVITGIAWYDENANGQKDKTEKILSGIKVYLLNTETNNYVKKTNGEVLEATTNDNGVYVLNNIGNGKYIVVFEYNKAQYALTKYKAENVEETINSDVMINELSIENEKQQVASTDIIEINNENISGINIGLIELKDFSLKLDKYVNRILIQNSEGTTVKEYNDATVAKAELDKKKINGTTVIIEYKIRVTNIGEIDGYVKKIVDYAPSDLKFSSELNTDWYQSGNDLYNASLANEKIPAGESREVRLTLTKSMTENNIGLINNTAEIAESYNELGIPDSKSTPGNRKKGENDYGSADTILSIKTGGEVYITIAIIILVALAVTATVIIIRKKITDGDKK